MPGKGSKLWREIKASALGIVGIAGLLPGLGITAARPLKAPPEVISAAKALYADTVNTHQDQTREWLRQGVLRPVYLTQSRYPDWLIDVSRMPLNRLCGTGGCPLQIWVRSGKPRYIKAFENQVRGHQLEYTKGNPRPYLQVDFHGSLCGRTGVELCPFAFEWRPKDGFIESARFTQAVIIRAGALPQPMPILGSAISSDIPFELIAILNDQTSQCAKRGGTFETQGVVHRTPDLNEDGTRDWGFDNAQAYCIFAGATNPGQDGPVQDECAFLTCRNLVFLSVSGTKGRPFWQKPVDLGRSLYGYKIHPDGRFMLVRLSPKAPDDHKRERACESYALADCIASPVSFNVPPKARLNQGAR